MQKLKFYVDGSRLPIVIDFKKIPASFPLCFNTNCDCKESCLRFRIGANLPDGITFGPAIYPNSSADSECKFFKKLQTVRGAYGISCILNNVKKCDAPMLRSKIVDFLCGETRYSRYNKGVYILTPAQQQWIKDLLKDNGYDENVKFGHYTNTVIFSNRDSQND